MKAGQEKIDINLAVHRDTGKAFLVEVYDSGIQTEKVWLPASQVVQCEQVRASGRLPVYRFEVPEWLLEKSGLI